MVAALGLLDRLVAVSHECDFPESVRSLPRATECLLDPGGLSSSEIDGRVREELKTRGAIYAIDRELLERLQPNLILTQQVCDVCAIGYGSVAELAANLKPRPEVLNLQPISLGDILRDIGRVAQICGIEQRGHAVIAALEGRIESVRQRVRNIRPRPGCFVMEWADPIFCSGHWGPELVELAGGEELLGDKHQSSRQVSWEDVLAAQPEIMVLALCGYDVERARRDYELARRLPRFYALPAVQTGQVYLADANSYFTRPGPRIVDTLEILAGILHPKRFPEFVSSGPNDQRVVRAGTRS